MISAAHARPPALFCRQPCLTRGPSRQAALSRDQFLRGHSNAYCLQSASLPARQAGISKRTTVAQAEERGQVSFRRGAQSDAATIARMTAKESMNPLGLKPERFVVAVEQAGSEDLIGFAQVQPYGDPSQPSFLELRTLIVDPGHRGRGVGTQIVKKILDTVEGKDVYLTTLQSSIPFYTRHGFQSIALTSAPASLWFEIAAGLLVARIVAREQLVVLKRPA